MINENYRGGGNKNCPLAFLSWSVRNPNFLSLNQQKAGAFCCQNKTKAFIYQYFYD